MTLIALSEHLNKMLIFSRAEQAVRPLSSRGWPTAPCERTVSGVQALGTPQRSPDCCYSRYSPRHPRPGLAPTDIPADGALKPLTALNPRSRFSFSVPLSPLLSADRVALEPSKHHRAPSATVRTYISSSPQPSDTY